MSYRNQTALSTLRMLLGKKAPRHPWGCHCMQCTDWALARERLEEALPALLDALEAADAMRRGDDLAAMCESLRVQLAAALEVVEAADEMRSWYDKQMDPPGPEVDYDVAREKLRRMQDG